MTFLAMAGTSCRYAPGNHTVITPPVQKEIVLQSENKFQTIDGFGVNITPAQWGEGNLKSAIDVLIDDLGCTLIRFYCFGNANWLDPDRQNKDKTFPDAYLTEVYTSKVFRDALETFRYFNDRGIEPILSISGRIPVKWVGDNGERLVDFESYAEMAIILVKWARDKEDLHFSLFMPFNETNLGFQEGPFMEAQDCVPAIRESEFEFAWRSSRRIIRFLNDGCSAAQAWNAFDNLNEHDAEWAIYGLLSTDTLNWTYRPKKRYYAAKHIYRYVLPGFKRISWEAIGFDPDHRYAL